MNENLRPLTLGEILDRTAQLYRRNFLLFAGVAALPVGTMIAIVAVAGAIGIAAAAPIRSTGGSVAFIGLTAILIVLVALPVYFAAYVFSTAGLTRAAVSAQRGEKLTIRAALASVRPHFWRYLWLLILQMIVAALIPIAISGAVAGPLIYLASRSGVGLAGGVAIGFAVFLLIAAAAVAVVWRLLGYVMGMAVCVVEQKTAWDSLERSWKLSQGTRGRIFVMFLLVAALGMVVAMIADIPVLIIAGVSAAAGNGPQQVSTAMIAAEIVNVAVNFALQTLLAPVSWIGLVLFYYDQRVRKEGFDIEWMMERAGLVSPQPASGPFPLRDAGLAQPRSVAPRVESGLISGPALPPDTVEER